MKTNHPTTENNAHVLLLAIGEIGDDLISEPPQSHSPARARRPRRIRRMAAVAALLIVAVCIPFLRGFFIRSSFPNDQHGGAADSIGDGLHYMSYEGPVMPLFGAEAYDGVTVERAVTFDFSPFARYDLAATVTDAYTLQNTSEEEITLQLYYPFSATLAQADTLLPKLTLGGEKQEASLLVGAADMTESLRDARKTAGYLAYTALLQDGSYFAATLQDVPTLSLPVTVYAITDYVIRGEGKNPTLNFTYQMDPTKTGVLTLGFNGGSNDRKSGKYARHFSVPALGEHGYGEVYYLIVAGDDLQNLQMQGYQDGGCDRGEEIEITAKVTRTVTTLADFIRERIAEEDNDALAYDPAGTPIRSILSHLSDEEYFAQYMALLSPLSVDTIYENWNDNCPDYESLVWQVCSSERVMYLALSVTLAAHESVELSAVVHKEASLERIGNVHEGHGFDVMTTLGSSLHFVDQSITLTGLQDLTVSNCNLSVAPIPADRSLPAVSAHHFLVVNRQPAEE